MRSDIERYLAGRPVQAPVPPPTPVAPPPPPESPDPATSTAMRPPVPPPTDDYDDYDGGRSGPRIGILVLLGVLVIVLLLGGWLLFKSNLFESPPKQVQVPNVIGMTEADARNAIGDAGLSVDAPDFRPDDDPTTKGKVLEQDPNRDQYVDPGTSVHLTISSGLPQVQVPFLIGSTQDEARNKLRDAKLKPEFTSVESDKPQGEVLQTAPEGGATVDQGSTVTVTISKGPHLVPDVVGMNRSDAIKQIVDAGFTYSFRGDDKSTEPRGTVTDQLPPAGQPEPQGTEIVLFVSTYEPPPPPPTEPPTTAPPTTLPPTGLPTPTPRSGAGHRLG